MGFNHITDAVLESSEVRRGEGIRFGNNGDEIDSSAQTLHDFDVEGLESVAGRANEVEAGVDAQVDLVGAAGLLLLKHV